jgi:DNA-binding response OmpR family regulator
LQNVTPIVVDVGARLVRREGIEVQLAPKAFDLLLILVKNQPNAVAMRSLETRSSQVRRRLSASPCGG